MGSKIFAAVLVCGITVAAFVNLEHGAMLSGANLDFFIKRGLVSDTAWLPGFEYFDSSDNHWRALREMIPRYTVMCAAWLASAAAFRALCRARSVALTCRARAAFVVCVSVPAIGFMQRRGALVTAALCAGNYALGLLAAPPCRRAPPSGPGAAKAAAAAALRRERVAVTLAWVLNAGAVLVINKKLYLYFVSVTSFAGGAKWGWNDTARFAALRGVRSVCTRRVGASGVETNRGASTLQRTTREPRAHVYEPHELGACAFRRATPLRRSQPLRAAALPRCWFCLSALHCCRGSFRPSGGPRGSIQPFRRATWPVSPFRRATRLVSPFRRAARSDVLATL